MCYERYRGQIQKRSLKKKVNGKMTRYFLDKGLKGREGHS